MQHPDGDAELELVDEQSAALHFTDSTFSCPEQLCPTAALYVFRQPDTSLCFKRSENKKQEKLTLNIAAGRQNPS